MSERITNHTVLNRVILTLTIAGASLTSTASVAKPAVAETEPVSNPTIIYGGGSCNTDLDCYTNCLPGGPGATGGYAGTCRGLPTSCYKDGTLIEPATSAECYVSPADVIMEAPSTVK